MQEAGRDAPVRRRRARAVRRRGCGQNPNEFENDVQDGMVSPQQGQGGGRGGAIPAATSKTSPDGKFEALIQNYNVFLRAKGSKDTTPLSWDGAEGNAYTFQSIEWSPDSAKLAAYRVRSAGLQARSTLRRIVTGRSASAQTFDARIRKTRGHARYRAADAVRYRDRKQTVIDNATFPNPYSISRPVWRKDSRAFTFEYNQRGHQIYRVIEVGASGAARALITEESKTFIDYRALVPSRADTGKKVRVDLNDGKEIVWASERDGWEHLYLYDGAHRQS